MPQENIQLAHIKRRFLIADMDFRMKIITVRSYNEILVEVLVHLLDALDMVEPYYTQFKEEAETQWQEAQKLNYLTPKTNNHEKESIQRKVQDVRQDTGNYPEHRIPKRPIK